MATFKDIFLQNIPKLGSTVQTQTELTTALNNYIYSNNLNTKYGMVRHVKIPNPTTNTATFYGFLTLQNFELYDEFAKLEHNFVFKNHAIKMNLSNSLPRRSDALNRELEGEYLERKKILK